MTAERVLDAVGTTHRCRSFENIWFFTLGGFLDRLRREILQNLIKILQIPVLLICFMGIDFVGFWIDFVGFFSPLRYE